MKSGSYGQATKNSNRLEFYGFQVTFSISTHSLKCMYLDQ